jgi:hypothetical protein
MTAALSIDFGNSYTKIGIRQKLNEKSQALRSDIDLRYDEDNLCIPTVAARVIENGKERWLYGTEVKTGSKQSEIQVFRNWKPHFFRGETTPPNEDRANLNGKEGTGDAWSGFTDGLLEKLLKDGTLRPAKEKEVRAELKRRKAVPEQVGPGFDYKEIGKGYFAWLRRFVEPFCKLKGIGTTDQIPVRITLPSLGENSALASLTLEAILKETGWKPATNRAALHEPVANLIGTFTGGRNLVWTSPKPGSAENYSLVGMIGDSTLFKAIRSFAHTSRHTRPPIYWVMIADLGGYTTDFAMVGFDLDNAEICQSGRVDGKRLLGDLSKQIGVHDLDKQIGDVLNGSQRKAFETLVADVDGLRIDFFHQAVYQNLRAYNTGKGIIGQEPNERKSIEEVIRQFADRVAESAEEFLLIEQYDHIDELILTGGGFNIPLVREAIRRKLERYNLKNSHIPLADQLDIPPRCRKLERILVRGATALGATSVYFDYD